ncbi:hypothetical protein NQ315_013302, partial [Exocentrus adspersus]
DNIDPKVVFAGADKWTVDTCDRAVSCGSGETEENIQDNTLATRSTTKLILRLQVAPGNMANLTTVEQFDCNGDPSSLGIRWEKWKRALQIYLFASNINNSKVKRAVLLHSGGLGLQEIFYNIPGANVDDSLEENKDKDVFDIALQKLDEYFLPKISKIYERHLFRLMEQEENEKFDKFVVRLRDQAEKCKFADTEGNIIDQITEKCSSKELRQKILSLGDDASLHDIIRQANTLESVSLQMKKFEATGTNGCGGTSTVNKIQT